MMMRRLAAKRVAFVNVSSSPDHAAICHQVVYPRPISIFIFVASGLGSSRFRVVFEQNHRNCGFQPQWTPYTALQDRPPAICTPALKLRHSPRELNKPQHFQRVTPQIFQLKAPERLLTGQPAKMKRIIGTIKKRGSSMISARNGTTLSANRQ